jgi:hypothetical protein
MQAAVGRADGDILVSNVNISKLAQLLRGLDLPGSVDALRRCMDNLTDARLVTFSRVLTDHSNRQLLVQSLATHVLLSQQVSLTTELALGITVNEVISLGLALAQRAVAAQEQRAVVTQVQQEPAELCQLHWPRIYTWAVTKVRVCVYVCV